MEFLKRQLQNFALESSQRDLFFHLFSIFEDSWTPLIKTTTLALFPSYREKKKENRFSRHTIIILHTFHNGSIRFKLCLFINLENVFCFVLFFSLSSWEDDKNSAESTLSSINWFWKQNKKQLHLEEGLYNLSVVALY